MSDFFSKDKKLQDSAHQRSDVDGELDSLHHTLGPNRTQAAPGNHKHDTLYVPKGTYRTDQSSDFPNIGSWTKNWSLTTVVDKMVNYRGQITLNAGFGGTAYMSLPVVPHADNGTVGLFNLIGQAIWLRQGVAYIYAGVYLDLVTPTYGRAAFYRAEPIQIITGTVPFTWAATDIFSWNVNYMGNV